MSLMLACPLNSLINAIGMQVLISDWNAIVVQKMENVRRESFLHSVRPAPLRQPRSSRRHLHLRLDFIYYILVHIILYHNILYYSIIYYVVSYVYIIYFILGQPRSSRHHLHLRLDLSLFCFSFSTTTTGALSFQFR